MRTGLTTMIPGGYKTLAIGFLILFGGVAVTQSLTENSVDSNTTVNIEQSVTIPDEKFNPSDVQANGPVSVIVSNDNTRACVHVGKSADDTNILYVPLKNKYRDSLTYRLNISFEPSAPSSMSIDTVEGDEFNDGKKIEGVAKTKQGNAIVELPGAGSQDASLDRIAIEYDASNIDEEVTTCLNTSPISGVADVGTTPSDGADSPSNGDGDTGSDDGSDSQPPYDIDQDGFNELGHDVDGDNFTETIAVRYWDANEVGMVAIDNSGELENISTGNVQLPSNNSDTTAIGPPLDFDGDDKLEIPFIGKTSGGDGPYLYITDTDAALPTRVTELDMKPKGVRIGRANTDGDEYADVIIANQNNGYIESIDGNDEAPMQWQEKGFKELQIDDDSLYDIVNVTTNSGEDQLYAAGSDGALLEVESSLDDYTRIEDPVKGPELSNTIRVIQTAAGESEIWGAGEDGSVFVYNRSDEKVYNFRHKLSFDNTFYDMRVNTTSEGTRVITLVNESTKITRISIERENNNYKINDTTDEKVSSNNGFKAIGSSAESIYVAGKKHIYKSNPDGWESLGELDTESRITELSVQGPDTIFAVRENGKLVKWNGRRFTSSRLSKNGNRLNTISMLNQTTGFVGTKVQGSAIYRKQSTNNDWVAYTADPEEAVLGVVTVGPNTSYGVGQDGHIFGLTPSRPLQGESNSDPHYKGKGMIGSADIDADGDVEFLYQGQNNGHIKVRDDYENREVLSTNNKQYSVTRVATGVRDVDNDSQLEIVFHNDNNNGELRVLDLSTDVSVGIDTEELPSKRNPALIDMDSDQVPEIVYISTNKELRMLDLVEDTDTVLQKGEYRAAT